MLNINKNIPVDALNDFMKMHSTFVQPDLHECLQNLVCGIRFLITEISFFDAMVLLRLQAIDAYKLE